MNARRARGGAIRVALDVTSAIDERPSGVARYIRGLAEGLAGEADVDLTLLCRATRFRRGDPRAIFPGLRVERWLDWGQLRAFDLLHAPDLRPPRRPPETLVTTVHDLSALDRSDHASERFLARKRRWLAVAAGRSERVITHTDAVGRELIARVGIPRERVAVVPLWPALPLGNGEGAARGEPGELRELIVIGGPSRRKRSERIARFLGVLERESRLRPAVAWCGSAAPAEVEEFRASLPAETRGRLDLLGYLDDAALDRRLRSAGALLQLSDTEGFGLPLLEAALRRTPVIAWRSATAEEVLSAAGAFWLGGADESAELRAFTDPAERARRAAVAAARAARFTREATVAATLAVYRSALISRSASAAAG